MTDAWYFAYGSNLSVDQKELRTGGIRQAIRSHLPGFRFAFNKRGSNGEVYANLLPEPGQLVWGVIYLCNRATLREMARVDRHPGGHYERLTVQVLTEEGEQVQAVTHVAGDKFVCPEGIPNNDYLARIVSGARQHRLPEDYIRQVERLAGRPET